MSNGAKTIIDDVTGNMAKYLVLDDGTVVIMRVDTQREVMRVVPAGDSMHVQFAPPPPNALFTPFWEGDGAVGRCVNGCIAAGGVTDAGCIAHCALTHGGSGWF